MRIFLRICSVMKRSRDSSSREGSSSSRREVAFYTYKKWMTELECGFQTLSWLDCDTGSIEGKKVVTKLKCKICTKHQLRINGRKHFSNKWIDGADSSEQATLDTMPMLISTFMQWR